MDLYRRVRLACHVDGLSQREAGRRFGLSRETVKKMLAHSVPPGYRRREPVKRPKLGPFMSIIACLSGYHPHPQHLGCAHSPE